MRKILSFTFAIIAWFAVFAQYYLMVQNRIASITETTIRFVSFFTILTNTIVAFYFTIECIKLLRINKPIAIPGLLTAVTMYITIVGTVYQVLLRHIWSPVGLQKLVDELLHSVMPVLVIVYWILYENKGKVHYYQIPKWLIYPLVYLIYVLIRGSFSGFYPYPFLEVTSLGLQKVLLNSFYMFLFFLGISFLFVWLSKITKGMPHK
ncbi:Pr6Pr family membrane protein [Ferruginibacter albus]|uniref:Pr6Pr family membrane protein n=1 Tax=Ferruginibacter albus TaxID=2875540 RepID=UPI001CC73044|nr:Pr6Pr family membrane protein [Ferruginibacter albus]UAY53573.1 Pr6Pr family membrane protein [Ferruginibacter albus]